LDSGTWAEDGGAPGGESVVISLAIWINAQYTNVTDRQTDGHRPTASTALTQSVARQKVN